MILVIFTIEIMTQLISIRSKQQKINIYNFQFLRLSPIVLEFMIILNIYQQWISESFMKVVNLRTWRLNYSSEK